MENTLYSILLIEMKKFEGLYNNPNRHFGSYEPARSLLSELYTIIQQPLPSAESTHIQNFPEREIIFVIETLNRIEKAINSTQTIVDKVFHSAIERSIDIFRMLHLTREVSEMRSNFKEAYDSYVSVIDGKVDTFFKDFNTRYEPQLRKFELAVQEETFSTAAKKNNKAATSWLCAIGVTGVALVIIIFWLWNCPYIANKDITTIKEFNLPNSIPLLLNFFLVKSILTRVLITSLAAVALSFCIKNYSVNKHNYTVNMQRANSIHGARWLIDKASSKETGDQIMLYSANAIFSHQPTGYSKKDPENMNGIAEKVFEKVTDKLPLSN